MTDPMTTKPEDTPVDEPANGADALREKLADALTPGYQAELDPEEAERAGAFIEDALSEEDAAESAADRVDATVPAEGDADPARAATRRTGAEDR